MLKPRQLDVLRLVVQMFTATGQPVGSTTLKNAGIQASTATIRNDLALLEQLGLLEKTHVSSGRVPSMKGYRFYVDHLLQLPDLEAQEISAIHNSFSGTYSAMNDLIEQSVKMLSQLTHYTAFAIEPEMGERVLTGFRLVPLNRSQVMAVIITNKGSVESHIFSTHGQLDASDLDHLAEVVNQRFIGETLVTIRQRLRTELPLTLRNEYQNSQALLSILEFIFSKVFEDKIYVSGQMNLLNDESITNVKQFKQIYSLINDQERLLDIIPAMDEPVKIKIGDEIHNELLADMSLIAANYHIDGHGSGVIALLGPSKMSYAKTIGLVNGFRKELENQVSDYYKVLDSSN